MNKRESASFFRLPALFLSLVMSSYNALAGGTVTMPNASQARPQCFYLLASSNLQNFILTPNGPNNEFVRTPEQMSAKIRNLGKAIASLTANATNEGRQLILGFVGLLEASTPENLNRLISETELRDLGLKTQIMSSVPDGRGINTGLMSVFEQVGPSVSHLYYAPEPNIKPVNGRIDLKNLAAHLDTEDITTKNVRWLWQNSGSLKGNGPPTRAILESTLKLPNGEELHSYVNHWPSKLEGEVGVVRRQIAARYIYNLWQAELRRDPRANILSVHDANTDVYGPELLSTMPLERPPQHPKDIDDSKLYVLNYDVGNYHDRLDNFHAAHPNATPDEVAQFTKMLQKEYGTYYYSELDNWNALDIIIVSGHMLRYYVPGSFEIVRRGDYLNAEGQPNKFNSDTNTGVTDHFPVGATFAFGRR